MNKIDDKKINDLIHSIGLNNYIIDAEVKKIVESQFRFTYDQIRSLSVLDKTEEELNKLKTNFTYKYIGKLHTNADVIRRQQTREELIKQKKNEQQELKSSRCIESDDNF